VWLRLLMLFVSCLPLLNRVCRLCYCYGDPVVVGWRAREVVFEKESLANKARSKIETTIRN
jgi:hypothetical protein